jgi:hypothetical protein
VFIVGSQHFFTSLKASTVKSAWRLESVARGSGEASVMLPDPVAFIGAEPAKPSVARGASFPGHLKY